MPIFQKQPEPAPTPATSNRGALLGELLGAAPAAAGVPATPPTTPRPRRKAIGTYETVMYKAAVVIGLAIAAGIWYGGAYFTVQWLGSVTNIAAMGLLPWLLPVAVTALEIGCVLGRRRAVWLWAFWLVVLAFDVYTTASGLMTAAEGRSVFAIQFSATDATSWLLLSLTGIAFALIPEPAARSLWSELWS